MLRFDAKLSPRTHAGAPGGGAGLLDPAVLLGRAAFVPDPAALATAFSGKRVLVTGGAGSIGREIAAQIAGATPQRLTLLDRSESGLYMTRVDLGRRVPGVPVDALVGDILDTRRLSEVLAACRPEVVFHAAAYKQVPMMEDNEVEAFRNNVIGTISVATAAAACGAGRFVLISTDKAVNPAGIMGATKRLAEMAVLAIPGPTAMICVRFGNVLGSDGSVVRVFEKQIADGGPVTVTHPEASRYFMTIEEAVGLVLEAGAMGSGGEVLCLPMGRPVGILSLARHMIERAVTQAPGRDLGIVFTGLRPGEKLHEESLTGPPAGGGAARSAAQGRPIRQGIIRSAVSRGTPDLLERISALHRAFDDSAAGERRALVRRALMQLIPEFGERPSPKFGEGGRGRHHRRH